MNRILYFVFIIIGLISCNNSKPSKDASEKNTDDTVELIEKVNISEADAETEISYKTLKSLLESNQPIPKKYFTDSEIPVNTSLHNHTILQTSDKYDIVRSTDAEILITNYYLLSFSKNTGKLISFVNLGQETEGVEPYKVSWESDTVFTTVDYQYELLEDKESGAYIQGTVQDSTVRNYRINKDGFIAFRD